MLYLNALSKTISDTQITSLDLSDIPSDYKYMTQSEIMEHDLYCVIQV